MSKLNPAIYITRKTDKIQIGCIPEIQGWLNIDSMTRINHIVI